MLVSFTSDVVVQIPAVVGVGGSEAVHDPAI